MAELVIYDSQGTELGRPTGRKDSRIEQFFFDGVRFAVDTSGRTNELVCFFRARESSASRAEQYYAVYTTNSIQEFAQFPPELEAKLESEHGLSVATTADDTAIYEQLRSDTNAGPLRQTDDLEDVRNLIFGEGRSFGAGGGVGDSSSASSDLRGSTTTGLGDTAPRPTQAKIGVGSYSDAFKVFSHFQGDITKRSTIDGIVIAENADSTHLSDYDIVIEKGSHVGVTLLPDTNDAIEQIKEQREKMRKKRMGEYEDGTGLLTPQVLGGVSLLLVAVVIGGIYAACLFGAPLPDFIPGCGGETDAEITLNSADVDADGLVINGSVGTSENTTINAIIVERMASENDAEEESTSQLTLEGERTVEVQSLADGEDWDALHDNPIELRISDGPDFEERVPASRIVDRTELEMADLLGEEFGVRLKGHGGESRAVETITQAESQLDGDLATVGEELEYTGTLSSVHGESGEIPVVGNVSAADFDVQIRTENNIPLHPDFEMGEYDQATSELTIDIFGFDADSGDRLNITITYTDSQEREIVEEFTDYQYTVSADD